MRLDETEAAGVEQPSSWAFEPGSVGDWLSRLTHEDGLFEYTQLGLWGVCALLGVAMVVRLRVLLDRWFGAWLALVSVLIVAREADAHVYLNPETLGGLGVRYRIDWWLSGETSVGLRAVWAVVFVVLGAALFVPAWWVSPRHKTLLLGRDRAWWCFFASGFLIGLGWVMDDLLGRGQFVPPVYTQAMEESFELVAPTAFAAAMVMLLWVPLGEREARAATRREKKNTRSV